MIRFQICNMDMDEATGLLDDNIIPYDFDGRNRIMIRECYAKIAVALWDNVGIDYDEI